MINLAAAIGLGGKQKDPNKDTAVGNVPPHSHDNSKNNNTMNPIGNITGNLNNNLKVQELGANLFQGEALAEQEMAKRNLGKPVMPPSPDPMGDQYGMQFNQPFAQNKLTVHPVPQQPPLGAPKVPEVPTKPITKIYKEKVPKQKMVKEMTGLQVEQRIHRHEKKMEKPEMPKKVIPPTNMNGDPKKSDTLYLPNEYKKQAGKMIDETDYDDLSKKIKNYNRKSVEDLQDLGKIKLNKKGKPYVVNRKN